MTTRDDIPPCTCAEFRARQHFYGGDDRPEYVGGVGCLRHPNASVGTIDKQGVEFERRSAAAVKGWTKRRARQFRHDEEPERLIIWQRRSGKLEKK